MDPRGHSASTALKAARAAGRSDLVRLLIDAGSRDDLPQEEYDLAKAVKAKAEPPLSALVWSANIETLRPMIQTTKDADTLNLALMHAAAAGRVDAARLLLDQGADIHARGDKGWTALHWQLQGLCNEPMLRLLMVRGADANAKDEQGFTALAYAVMIRGECAVRPLLSRSVDVNVKSRGGVTPLMLAVRSERILSSRGIDGLAVPRMLIEAGAELDAKDDRGKTALMRAAELGSTDFARLLLQKGARIDAVDDRGHTALMFAAANGRTETTLLLLEKGAGVDIKSLDKATALDYTIIDGLTADRSGMAYHQVSSSQIQETAALLRKHGATKGLSDATVLLMHEAYAGHAGRVRALLASGADINARNIFGSDPLRLAVVGAHPDVALLLIEHGADVNAANSEGETPLMCAAVGGRAREMTRLLLEHGARLETKTDRGESVVELAKESGRWDVALALKDSAAK